jgi:hypothetical protein
MSDTLRICEGFVELEGQRVARLLPIAPTLVYRLTETFDELADADDDTGYIEHLEDQIEDLKSQIADLRKQLAKARR